MTASHVDLINVSQKRIRLQLAAVTEKVNQTIEQHLKDLAEKIEKLQQEKQLSTVQSSYLKKILNEKKSEEIDPKLIDKLKNRGGYCAAFTPLTLYGLKLSKEEKLRFDEKGRIFPRDDIETLMALEKKLDAWDAKDITPFLKEIIEPKLAGILNRLQDLGETAFLSEEVKNLTRTISSLGLNNETERFLSDLLWFQKIENFVPNMTQGQLNQYVFDNLNRSFRKEYTLTAPLLTQEDFDIVFREILHPGKLIYLAVPHHALGMYKSNDGTVYFYDSNQQEGFSTFPPGMTINISEKIKGAKRFIFTFQIFDFNTNHDSYASQESILNRLSFLTTNPPTLPIERDRTVLHQAAFIGDAASLQVYLNLIEAYNVQSQFINAQDDEKQTALYIAAKRGFAEVVKKLIQNKADVDIQNNENKSPFMIALQYGHADVLQLLIKAGAKFDSVASLFTAVENGFTDIVDVLLQNGCNIQVKNPEGQSLLQIAIAHSPLETIDFLIKKGAQVDDHLLSYVIAQGNNKIINLVRAAYYQVNLPNKSLGPDFTKNLFFKPKSEKEITPDLEHFQQVCFLT